MKPVPSDITTFIESLARSRAGRPASTSSRDGACREQARKSLPALFAPRAPCYRSGAMAMTSTTLLVLTSVFALGAFGCAGAPKAPFDTLKDSNATVYHLQNFEP